MAEEVTPVAEEAVAVDLDANPADGTVASTDAGFQAKAEEPAVEEPAAAAEEPATDPASAEAEEEPAKEATEEPAAEDKKGADASVWGDTGSDLGNSVLGMLEDSGISTDDAKALLFDAVQAGDITKVDTAALTAKVGKHAANIILSGTKGFIAENAAKNEAVIAGVHEAAGGKDNWESAAAWASSNMEADALAEYRPMIDKGGASARFAVSEILAAYNADGNNSTIAPTTPRAEGTSVSPPASTATTRAQYVAALEKAHKRNASPKEIAIIQANRNNGRKQGI